MAQTSNERNGRCGGAKVEGEEGSRVARHAVMLPREPSRHGRVDSPLSSAAVRTAQAKAARERSHLEARKPNGAARQRPPGPPRRRPLRVPGDFFVELFQPCDELLDSRVVGKDLRGAGEAAAEQAAEDRIEEQHRVGAERAVGSAGLQEVDGGARQAAELDLTGNLFDELVSLLLGRFVRKAQATAPLTATDGSDGSAVAARAASKAR